LSVFFSISANDGLSVNEKHCVAILFQETDSYHQDGSSIKRPKPKAKWFLETSKSAPGPTCSDLEGETNKRHLLRDQLNVARPAVAQKHTSTWEKLRNSTGSKSFVLHSMAISTLESDPDDNGNVRYANASLRFPITTNSRRGFLGHCRW
jgi:hypothetical protein